MNLAERVDPRRAALVVVDVQNDFFHAQGEANKSGKDAVFRGIIPKLKVLVAEARMLGIPIIFIRTIHDAHTDTLAWLDRKAGVNKPGGSSCTRDTWGSEFYEVTPQPTDAVIIKHRYSAFANTSLSAVLNKLDRNCLILTGIATEVCVESTARDAVMLDNYIVVVNDCTAGATEEEHQASLSVLQKHFGLVAASEEILHLWRGQSISK